MGENFRNIGRIVSASGLQGDLIIRHHLGKNNPLKGLEVIFLEDKTEEMLPYFVQSSKMKKGGEVSLRLEGIASREAALKLLRKEVWLKEEDFRKHALKTAPISWVGFHLVNEDKDLGEILEVIEQPHQVLLRLEIGKKEVLVPANDETLIGIDAENRRVFVRLPEGLLEIYLA